MLGSIYFMNELFKQFGSLLSLKNFLLDANLRIFVKKEIINKEKSVKTIQTKMN